MRVTRWIAPLLLVAPLGCKPSVTSSPPNTVEAPSPSSGVRALGDAATEAPRASTPAAAPTLAAAPASPAPASEETMAAFAKADRAFAVALYDRLRASEGNAFFSPTSVRLALSMTWAGARGETASEMARVLGLTGSPDEVGSAFATMLRTWAARADVEPGPDADDYEKQQAAWRRELLRVVNRLWGQTGRTFRAEYLDLLRTSFGAPLETLDFRADAEGARQAINGWVDRETEHRIQDLLGQGTVTKDTRLVLTNAVYFKASWAKQFEEGKTKEGAFRTSAKGSTRAQLMEQTARLRYGETSDARLLELPYASRDMAMVVVLPRAADGLAAVERKMDSSSIERWLGALGDERVHVVLPKLRTTSSFALGSTLSAMGMPSAFSPEKADFSGIDGTRELFVSAVVHKAFVAVDEKGTEAAAATAVAMTTMALPLKEPPPKEFRADHPFLFFVYDVKLGDVLFMGRITDPTR